MLVHRDVARLARVRVVMAFIGECFARDAVLFAGLCPQPADGATAGAAPG